MKKSFTKLFASTLLLVTLTSCGSSVSADSVIYGNIYTSTNENNIVEAVAIKDGKILYVGSKDGAKKFVGSSTEVKNFSNDKLITAGLVDAHTHVTELLVASSESLGKISKGANKATAVSEIRAYVENNSDLSFYTLTGWEMQNFSEEEYHCPTADMLDGITTKPILAFSSDGHTYWTNKPLMNLAGVTRDTKCQDGGEIVKDSSGEPLGIFKDTAQYIIDDVRPEKSKQAYINGIKATDLLYLSLGYTYRFDALTNKAFNSLKYPQVTYLEELDKLGQLKTYSQGSFVINNVNDAYEFVNVASNLRNKTKGGNFELTNVKIFLDGIVENAGAYLSEDYSNAPGYRGSQRWKGQAAISKLGHLIAIANQSGMSVHFHGMGDQAISDILTAIEYAANEVGLDVVRNARNAIAHLALVKDTDFKRFADLNVIATFNPWCNKDPGYYSLQCDLLGKERADKQYPMQSFLKNGVKYSFGTDLGASDTYETIECFHALVTRKYKTHTPESLLNEAEKLSREEALKAMTIGGAYQMKKENEFGTLEVGKDASFTVFSQDLLKCEDDKIMNTSVENSMYKGIWSMSPIS